MKTNPTSKYTLATAAAAGMLMFAGCFNDPSSPGGNAGNADATLEGHVQGDMALAKRASGSLGIEGATVTVMRIKPDGSLEAASGVEAKTDAQGHFSLRTAADGARELVVVARKEAEEWKSVVSAQAAKGATVAVRPLNTESSVEADVLIKARGQVKAVQVCFADIAAHVDAEMAMKASGKADVEAYISAQLQTEAEARTSVLIAGPGKLTLEQLAKADEARMDAEARLEADLEAAQSSASVDAQAKAESDFQQAEFKAFADAGIDLGEVAKAREASFRAMVESGVNDTSRADTGIDADAKLTWLHKIAARNAVTLEAAVDADVKASGGQSGIAASAGLTLQSALNASKGRDDVDSAFAAFRASVSTGLKAFIDASLGGKAMLSDSSQARMDLKASLALATTPDMVAEAYRKFYADAEAEIKGNISVSGGALDSSGVRALARAVLLIGIQGNGGGGVSIGGNFSLSGQVEGNVPGADVQVAKIKSDGSLEIIPGFSGKTDAGGGFTLKSDAKVPDSAVIVITKSDSSKLLTFVDSTTAKPVQVGTETTVETQVYQQMIKEGKPGITLDQIRSQVDSQVAVSVKGDDSAMVRLLAGLETSYEAQNEFLMDSGFGLSTSTLTLIASARASAETKLEADLRAAAGAEASIRNAYDTYHQSLLAAYVQAGLDASAYARSQQVYAQALAHFSAGLAAQTRLDLMRSAHASAARGLRTASEAELKASGATEASLASLTDAGAALQASVEAAVSEDAIVSAYGAYHAAAIASLKSTFLLQAKAIDTLDAGIRGQDGARGQLMAAIQSGTDAGSMGKAQVDFAARVETETKVAFGSGLGAPTGAQIKTMAEAMILANMGG